MNAAKEILNDFQAFLKKEKLDLFIINSTDEYLNEYVSAEKNSRCLLTGFSGSTGDVIVTSEDAMLFVDGRYHLQAEMETDPESVKLVKVGLGISPQKALYEKLAELCGDRANIGIVSSKTSCAGFKELLKNLKNKQNIKILEYEEDPVFKIAGIPAKTEAGKSLRYIPVEISGKSPVQKLESVNNYKSQNRIDLLLVTDLADIAYLANLRGMEIPYSSCFKSKALVFRDKAYIFTDLNKLCKEITENFGEDFVFKQESEFDTFIEKLSREENVFSVYYHPNSTTLAVFRKIEKLAEKVVEIKESYISELKSIKNSRELKYIAQCYLKTDIALNRVMCWLNQSLEKGGKISEKDFSNKIKSLLKEEEAVSLSFEPITTVGINTAFIHYTCPDPQKFIKKGDLILLDCGAYFEGGYATDQTRTFLAAGHEVPADDLQKILYTAVLKGFLKGINLEISENTTGYDLDYSVREAVEANKPEGFEFSHATGHGVGIPVHESPPRIGPSESSKIPLKAGMVFTVEPGLYKENQGGVRLENTVMIVEEDGKVKIKTLTRAPLDENLINYDKLTEQEKTWLENYNRFKIG